METEFWKLSQPSFFLPVVVKTYLDSCKKQCLNRKKPFPTWESLCIDKYLISEHSISFP